MENILVIDDENQIRRLLSITLTANKYAVVEASTGSEQSDVSQPVLEFGDLTIDLDKHYARKKGEIIKLTSTEFSLLNLFAQNESRVLTHSYILKKIWGVGYSEQPQNLRVFIAQLRKKIEDDPANPKFILTESGIGYRFCFN